MSNDYQKPSDKVECLFEDLLTTHKDMKRDKEAPL